MSILSTGGGRRMQNRKIEDWGIEYIKRYSLYQEYARRMKHLLQDLIERERVQVYALEGWAKTPDEFFNELSNKKGVLPADPFRDVPDLATVRILMYFPSDVMTVERVIQEEFLVDLPRSTTSKDLEDPDIFGYKSIIYDVSLKSDRGRLREWEKYRDLKIHVQVRTMLQEAWAAVSPEISGTTDIVTKGKLKRKLSRVSALLEEADEDFHFLREAARKMSIPVTPDKGMPIMENVAQPKDLKLTKDSLRQVFENNGEEIYSLWARTASEIGFPRFAPDRDYVEDSLDYLFRILDAAEISTADRLMAFLDEMSQDDRGSEQLRTVFSAFEDDISSWRVDGYSAVFLLVLNMKWDVLQNKDLLGLGIKAGSDRIKGL